MRVYWEIAKRALSRQLTYRTATLAGLATNFYFGLLRAAVMAALYGARAQVDGISLQAAITYTGLAQSLIAVISLLGWFEVMRSINKGEISSDLLRPIGYFKFWLAQDLGKAAAQLALRGIPLMLGYALFFDILLPQTLWHWLAVFLALGLAVLLSFSWRFLVNLVGFWVTDATSIGRVVYIFSWFLSGFLMPLRFFPDWFVRLCYLTPFPHTINTIVEIYLGVLTPGQMLRALLLQLAWFVGLTLACSWVLRRGIRHLVIQGG